MGGASEDSQDEMIGSAKCRSIYPILGLGSSQMTF